MCDDLEHSDFTSIQARITSYQGPQSTHQKISQAKQPAALLSFGSSKKKRVIVFSLVDYLKLADWSARAIHPQKRSYIDSSTSKLIEILSISEDD